MYSGRFTVDDILRLKVGEIRLHHLFLVGFGAINEDNLAPRCQFATNLRHDERFLEFSVFCQACRVIVTEPLRALETRGSLLHNLGVEFVVSFGREGVSGHQQGTHLNQRSETIRNVDF